MARLKSFGMIFTPYTKENDRLTIEIDSKPVVFCHECKQWDEESGMMGRGWCGWQMKCTGPTYFCADGEKKGKEDDGVL